MILSLRIPLAFFVFWCSSIAYFGFKGGFYRWDEWTLLSSLAQNPLEVWLFQPHLGHIFPVGRLTYVICLELFGLNYDGFILVNHALHALGAVILLDLLLALKLRITISALASFSYLIFYGHSENILWGLQSVVFICAASLLGILRLQLTPDTAKQHIFTGIFATIGAFSFGIGLMAPAFALVAYVTSCLLLSRRPKLKPILFYFALILVVVFSYQLILSSVSLNAIHPGALPQQRDGAGIATALQTAIFDIRFYQFWGRTSFVAPFAHLIWPSWLPRIGHYEVLQGSIYLLLLLLLGKYLGSRGGKGIILVGLCYALTLILFSLPALARYGWPAHLAYILRYSTFCVILSIPLIALGVNSVLRRAKTKKFDILCFVLWGLWVSFVQRPEMAKEMINLRKAGVANASAYATAIEDCKNNSCRDSGDLVNPKLNPELSKRDFLRVAENIFHESFHK